MESKKIVELAKKQLGNNYKTYCKAYGVNTDWCVIFIWWLFNKSKAGNLFCNNTRQAVVGNVARWGINAKQTVKLENAKAGDIVIFDWKGNTYDYDHIGIFVEKNKDGSYKTIEGNTLSDDFTKSKVAYRNRYKSDICLVIRPKYSDNQIAKKIETKLNLTRILKKGSTGTAVKNLQKTLGGLTVDGVYGEKTYMKVKEFQKKNKLTVDGLVGKNTAHKLGWTWCGK